ncbi:MAG: hypothetical protein QW597_04700 [Thermoplasmataceae archaeon]
MWDSEVLRNCIIVRVRGILPKIAGLHGREIKLDNTFFLIGIEGERVYIYRNLGEKISPLERNNIEGYSGSGSSIFVMGDTVLRLSVLETFWKILNKINGLPGFRMNPCILSHSTDLYVQIDYDEQSLGKNFKVAMEILNSLIEKNEIIYMGPQPAAYPYLIKLYRDFGCPMDDLTLVKTEWNMTPQEIDLENKGIFRNNGILVPKFFTNAVSDTILFKLYSKEVMGEALYRPVNDDNLIEMDLESKFFSDVYREVIMAYYGTLFYWAEVKGQVMTSNFIIDTSLINKFLIGLRNHWNIATRKNHSNAVVRVSKVNDQGLD